MSTVNTENTINNIQEKCEQMDMMIFQCHVWNLEARNLRTVEWQKLG